MERSTRPLPLRGSLGSCLCLLVLSVVLSRATLEPRVATVGLAEPRLSLDAPLPAIGMGVASFLTNLDGTYRGPWKNFRTEKRLI